MSIVLYFLNATIYVFVSWIIGLILNNLIKNRSFYSKISNLEFIKNDTIRKSFGLNGFGWMIKNTVFKAFNQNLQLKKGTTNKKDLKLIRNEMTYAEIGHIIGFLFILILIVYQTLNGQFLSAIILLVFNIIFNLYPTLLQQHNKKRIDRILKQ